MGFMTGANTDKLIVTSWTITMCRRKICQDRLVMSAMVQPQQVLTIPMTATIPSSTEGLWFYSSDSFPSFAGLTGMRRLHSLEETKSLQRNYLLGFQLFGDSSWPIPALLKWLFPQTGFPLKATNPAYPSAWWKIEVLGSGGLWPELFYMLLYKGIRDMKVYRAHFFSYDWHTLKVVFCSFDFLCLQN